MIRKVLGYAGMLVVAALLAQTMVTTYYLAQIDAGLNSSLKSTTGLIQIQNTIVHKNQTLQGVVQTTAEMANRLKGTLSQTELIDENIHNIDALNSDTLAINQGLVNIGNKSGQTLSGVAQNMKQLAQETKGLSNSLTDLNQLITQDRVNMDQMKGYANQMNQKTP